MHDSRRDGQARARRGVQRSFTVHAYRELGEQHCRTLVERFGVDRSALYCEGARWSVAELLERSSTPSTSGGPRPSPAGGPSTWMPQRLTGTSTGHHWGHLVAGIGDFLTAMEGPLLLSTATRRDLSRDA